MRSAQLENTDPITELQALRSGVNQGRVRFGTQRTVLMKRASYIYIQNLTSRVRMSVHIFGSGTDAPPGLTSPIDGDVPRRPRSDIPRRKRAAVIASTPGPENTCNGPLHGCSAFFSMGTEIAWGDIHGDFEALRELVRLSEVGTVDGAGGAEWTCGERTTVI